MKLIKAIILITFLTAANFSCVQDDDFSIPESIGLEENQDLTQLLNQINNGAVDLMTISQVKSFFVNGEVTLIESNIVVKGYVVSSDMTGNFYKEFYMQDEPDNPTAGIKVVINRKRDNFNRVSKLIIGGEPWQADKIYKIATSDFLLQGNAGLALLTQVPESQITRYEQGLRDVIVEYIKNNSPVSAVIDNRWKRDDSSKIDPNLEKELRKGFKN